MPILHQFFLKIKEEKNTLLNAGTAHSVLCLVAQLSPTLCDPLDWSTPAFPVHHQLPELAQTHVH